MTDRNTIEVTEPAPGVKLITLSRTTAANALSTAMGHELLALWTLLKSVLLRTVALVLRSMGAPMTSVFQPCPLYTVKRLL